MQDRCDVAIIGAGPAGLAMAALLSRQGLDVSIVERQPEADLIAPPPDGRDIALTHRSTDILKALGVWDRIPADEKAPIRRAAVRNEGSGDLLSLTPEGEGVGALGVLTGNNHIRAALYAAVKDLPSVRLVTGEGVKAVDLSGRLGRVTLGNGAEIEARLVIAADSRFSETRRMAGIGADMRDFGRVCIVCRMRHEKEHDATALEWFDTDRTLAVLPLNNNQSSIVVTLAADEAPHLMGVPAEEFARDAERRLGARWGRMELVGKRHAYPLVAVYAHRFHARRFALVGDAAVGMHPVTAHGYNFGLRGAATLSALVADALRTGGDIGSETLLQAYDREHRGATYPLYMATNALVGLYTDNGLAAGFARNALLRLGDVLSPVKSYIVHKLTEVDRAAAH